MNLMSYKRERLYEETLERVICIFSVKDLLRIKTLNDLE